MAACDVISLRFIEKDVSYNAIEGIPRMLALMMCVILMADVCIIASS